MINGGIILPELTARKLKASGMRPQKFDQQPYFVTRDKKFAMTGLSADVSLEIPSVETLPLRVLQTKSLSNWPLKTDASNFYMWNSLITEGIIADMSNLSWTPTDGNLHLSTRRFRKKTTPRVDFEMKRKAVDMRRRADAKSLQVWRDMKCYNWGPLKAGKNTCSM